MNDMNSEKNRFVWCEYLSRGKASATCCSQEPQESRDPADGDPQESQREPADGVSWIDL